MSTSQFISYYEQAENPELSKFLPKPTPGPSNPKKVSLLSRFSRTVSRSPVERVKENRKQAVKRFRMQLKQARGKPVQERRASVEDTLRKINQRRNEWAQEITGMGGDKKEAWGGFTQDFWDLVDEVRGAL